MMHQRRGFLDSYRAPFILTLLLLVTAVAQAQYTNIYNYGYEWQRGNFLTSLGFPGDTTKPHPTKLNNPHWGYKNGQAYFWDPLSQSYKPAGGFVDSLIYATRARVTQQLDSMKGTIPTLYSANGTLAGPRRILAAGNPYTFWYDANNYDSATATGYYRRRANTYYIQENGFFGLQARHPNFWYGAYAHLANSNDSNYIVALFSENANLYNWKQASLNLDWTKGAGFGVNVNWKKDDVDTSHKWFRVRHTDTTGVGAIEIDKELIPEGSGQQVLYDSVRKRLYRGTASGGGGGSVGTLQQVTDAGNTTTDTIAFTGTTPDGNVETVIGPGGLRSSNITNNRHAKLDYSGFEAFGWSMKANVSNKNLPIKSEGNIVSIGNMGGTVVPLKVGVNNADIFEGVIVTGAHELGHTTAFSAFNSAGKRLFKIANDGRTNFANLATDPVTYENGDSWLNTTTNRQRIVVNGAPQNITTDNQLGNLLQGGLVVLVDQSNPNATDSRAGISRYSITQPFKTIQAAVLGATHSDIIYVKNGTYNENVLYHHGVNTDQILRTWIFENVTLDGGASYALKINLPLPVKVFLRNTTIKNTGNAADPMNTAAVIFANADTKEVYGDNIGTAVIQSENAWAVAEATRVRNLTLKSNNSYALAGQYNLSTDAKYCNLISDNGTAVGGYGANLEDCYIKGKVMGYSFSATNGGSFFNGNFNRCYIEGTTGNAIGGGALGGAGTSFSITNSTLVSALATIDATNQFETSSFLSENNKITVTGSGITAAYVLPNLSSGVVRLTNTISNIQLLSESYRSSYATKIKETNTSILDTTAFFGVHTGFGTPSPTAQVDVKGEQGYNQLRMRTPYTPTSSSDANGNVGDIAWDENYFYIKVSVSPHTWRRSAHNTW